MTKDNTENNPISADAVVEVMDKAGIPVVDKRAEAMLAESGAACSQKIRDAFKKDREQVAAIKKFTKAELLETYLELRNSSAIRKAEDAQKIKDLTEMRNYWHGEAMQHKNARDADRERHVEAMDEACKKAVAKAMMKSLERFSEENKNLINASNAHQGRANHQESRSRVLRRMLESATEAAIDGQADYVRQSDSIREFFHHNQEAADMVRKWADRLIPEGKAALHNLLGSEFIDKPEETE